MDTKARVNISLDKDLINQVVRRMKCKNLDEYIFIKLQEDLKNQNSTLNLIIDNMILAEDKIGFTSVMDET